jgi:hypothetical protein
VKDQTSLNVDKNIANDFLSEFLKLNKENQLYVFGIMKGLEAASDVSQQPKGAHHK